MASAPQVPLDDGSEVPDVAVQQPWRKGFRLSSIADAAERFLDNSGFDRGPWLAVGFAGGIALWFWLDGPWQWIGALMALALTAITATSLWSSREDRAQLRISASGLCVALIAGMLIVCPPANGYGLSWRCAMPRAARRARSG